MNKHLNLGNYIVLPNGVNLKIYLPADRTSSCIKVGFNPDNLHITFFSNPNRPEKNFALANHSIELIKTKYSVDFHVLFDVDSILIPDYLSATDILISTSLWEGSPNIIKEAMACNTSVVSTNVGDVSWLFGSELGYYVTKLSTEDLVEKIYEAIDFIKRGRGINGRARISQLGLDSNGVAKKLISIYNNLVL